MRLELLGCLVVLSSALLVVYGRDTLSASLVGLSVTYAQQVSTVHSYSSRHFKFLNKRTPPLKIDDFQITETLYSWAKMMTEAETNIVAIERIKEYSETEQEAPWILPDEVVPKNWPEKGEIAFEDFRVRYREGLGLVLKGITFHVNGGEKVGIIGRTGAGKSSLSLCLFRLLESAGGSIIIDDIDISKMGLHTLRSRLTIIPQVGETVRRYIGVFVQNNVNRCVIFRIQFYSRGSYG